MARTHLAVDERRHGGQLHDRLGDPVTRAPQDPHPQVLQLVPGRGGADHDALAAGAVHRLDHELVEPVHHLLEVLRLAEAPGVDVAEDRLLGEVVADQVGHVGVDELVVGHAVADRVGQREVAGARCVEHPRAPEQRVAAEVDRVEELVVDPAVDHVHGREARGRPHHHPAPARDQVAALHELHAHRPREQRVLEVRPVEDPGGEHDDRRVGDTGRSGGPQGAQQPARVVVDGPDALVGEGLRQRRGDRAPVGHHVGHPRRHADVVLQHAELTAGVAHQVDPADVDADAVAGLEAGHLAVEVGGGDHDPARDHPVVEDRAGRVDVGEEELQGADSLLHAALDDGPRVRLDHPREDVERERPLLAADVEGDALVEVARLQRLGPSQQVGVRHVGERVAQPDVRRPEA